jgi:hypothetical protein
MPLTAVAQVLHIQSGCVICQPTAVTGESGDRLGYWKAQEESTKLAAATVLILVMRGRRK